jgi:hypothetical protein
MKHEHQQLGSLDKKQFSHLVTTLQQSGDLCASPRKDTYLDGV